jgi:hypothetical protein
LRRLKRLKELQSKENIGVLFGTKLGQPGESPTDMQSGWSPVGMAELSQQAPQD